MAARRDRRVQAGNNHDPRLSEQRHTGIAAGLCCVCCVAGRADVGRISMVRRYVTPPSARHLATPLERVTLVVRRKSASSDCRRSFGLAAEYDPRPLPGLAMKPVPRIMPAWTAR